MGRIRVLDDHLVNRIAAGEVVERPASVVKELVENSLDAGARSIEVRVAEGGRQRIAVGDDGCGMERDDAILSLTRHATSKLQSADDLGAIATLGFRGEAIPSIAAVSRLRLCTAARDGFATEIEVAGGRIDAVRDVARSQGTSIEVGSLFFNVPARRKFLRAASTEIAHIVRTVSHYAIAHPSVRFLLEHGGRQLVDAPRAADRMERIGQIHGRELARTLLAFDQEHPGLRVSGFAGRPVDASSRRDALHIFVNGRLVQDRVLSHAILAAYGDTLARGLYPAVLLFIEIDPARVDVNVHPQKSEVRFDRASEIHDRVRAAVSSALSATGAVPDYRDLRPSARGSGGETTVVAEPAAATSYAPNATAPASLLEEDAAAATPGRRAVPLAQFRDSYIIAEDREGLLVIDQHVAHERVLFERYLSDAARGEVDVQRLLFPKTIELAPDEAAIFEAEAGEFARLGFLLEPFGGTSVKLDGVPALAKDVSAEKLIRGLLGEAAAVRTVATQSDELRRKLVTSAACQAAIKVNTPLARHEMQRLLDDLFLTENPTTCPHGRPIIFRMPLADIERAFRRR